MSQPSFEVSSAPTVLTKRSAWSVWTVMLLVALISLLMAALFLFLEIREYGGFGTVKGPSGAALHTAPAIIQAA